MSKHILSLMFLSDLDPSTMHPALGPMQHLMDVLIDEESTIEKVRAEIQHFFSQHDREQYNSTVLYAVIYVSMIRPKMHDRYKQLSNEIIENYGGSAGFDIKRFKNWFKNRIIISDKIRVVTEPLKTILQNDDIEELKKYIYSRLDFDWSKRLNDLLWIVLCGSIKCFKFYLCNGVQASTYLNFYAIAGGNEEIIHFLEQNCGIHMCSLSVSLSIQYHRYKITDWLIFNQAKIFNTFTDLTFTYNFRAAQLFLKGQFDSYNTDELEYYPSCMILLESFRYFNIPVIQYAVDIEKIPMKKFFSRMYFNACAMNRLSLKKFFDQNFPYHHNYVYDKKIEQWFKGQLFGFSIKFD